MKKDTLSKILGAMVLMLPAIIAIASVATIAIHIAIGINQGMY